MKITFYGHFGSSNTGNESTLQTTLVRLRDFFPECDFCCVCTNPERVMERDAIDAVPISRRDVRIWNRGVRLDRRLAMALAGVWGELEEYLRAFRTLKGTDMLIVPGTGLLTDAYGLSAQGPYAWGPYNTFKWTLMAKLRGVKVLFISVGAGPLHRRAGRVLVKSALSLATYRSYRDDASRAYMESIGFRAADDPVYPDLVFGLPDSLVPRAERSAEGRRVVGLGLMVYAGKYSVADPIPETYRAYLESLARLVEWLLARGYDVRLLLGDDDTFVIDEFKSLLRSRVGAYDEERVAYQPVPSVPHVLAALNATDTVVATRFHNVLLALVLNKPTIAISFHHKCASLMSQMGLSEYCHDINHLDAEELIEQFQRLEMNREELKRVIKRQVDAARAALDQQYDDLFKSKALKAESLNSRNSYA